MLEQIIITGLALACIALLWQQTRLHRKYRAQTQSGDLGTPQAIEDALRQALEGAAAACALFDQSNRLVFCNQNFHEIYEPAATVNTGSTFETILRQGLAKGRFADTLGREEAWLAERLQEYRSPGESIMLHMQDGRHYLVADQVLPGGHSILLHTDVTEMKRREAELDSTQHQQREVLESLQEGFCLIDADNRLISWNQKYLSFFSKIEDKIEYGARLEDLLRAAAERMQFLEALEDMDAFIAKRVKAYKRVEGYYEARSTDGRCLLSRQYKMDGGHVLATFVDITELKEREAELREAKEAAEAANRVKSEFLANISHELRTPLNAVIGFSDLIMKEQAGPLGTDVYRDYAKDVNDCGRQLLEIVNDLIDLSRVEAGQLELRETEVNVGGLLRHVTRAVGRAAEAAEITLQYGDQPENLEFWGDERRIRQILDNLVGNAIKFTPTGGTVTLSADIDTEGCLVIEVSDTGIGMTPEEVRTALEPLRQVDSSLKRQFGGSGLGLTLCKSLIKLHDGSLEIESTKSGGTTVRVRLPAERLLEVPEPESRKVSPQGASGS